MIDLVTVLLKGDRVGRMREMSCRKVLSDKGIALLLVLWIVVLLSMAALSLSLLTRTEALSTLSAKEEVEFKYLAEAGIRRGVMELMYRQANPNPLTLPEGFEVFQCDGRAYTDAMGEGRYRLRITDESGKINLNMLNDDTGVLLKNLLMNGGVAEEQAAVIVDSVLDWKDKDDLHRLNGAEDNYYQSLPKPYKARNDAFGSLEELVFVRGVTPAILRGDAERKGLMAYCTIFTKVSKVNLNTAPPEVLKAVPGMTDAMLERILQYRDLKPAEKTQPIAGWIGADLATINPYVSTTGSNIYAIESEGYRKDEKRRYAVRATVVLEGMQKYRIIDYRSPYVVGS